MLKDCFWRLGRCSKVVVDMFEFMGGLFGIYYMFVFGLV